MPEYVVIGPGWGSDYLQPRGPSGCIAYRGESLTMARRELASMRASVERTRRLPGYRDVSNNYHILVWSNAAYSGTGGWVPVEE